MAKKGILCESAKCEGDRCLTCNVVCQVCADVCPNRANVVIELPDGRHQILHVDRMCNECGNCAVFCPYDSAPYREKFTLFLDPGGFDESVNNSGLPAPGRQEGAGAAGRQGVRGRSGRQERPARRHRGVHLDGADQVQLSAGLNSMKAWGQMAPGFFLFCVEINPAFPMFKQK